MAQQWLIGMWDTALAAFADEVDAAVEEREQPPGSARRKVDQQPGGAR